jgi:hypothetical protein
MTKHLIHSTASSNPKTQVKIFKNSVPTPQKTVSMTKAVCLMLHRKILLAHFETQETSMGKNAAL